MSSHTFMVHSEVREGALWILFDRPAARNAMTAEMEHAILALCESVAHRPEIKAVVFSGAPASKPAFMAGADFGALETATTAEEFVALERSSEALLEAIEGMRVPTIAAMAGACVGGGALLALCCDIRIATPSLKFGFPIARTVGNCLSVKNYARLAENLGRNEYGTWCFPRPCFRPMPCCTRVPSGRSFRRTRCMVGPRPSPPRLWRWPR